MPPNVLFLFSDQHNHRFQGAHRGPHAESVETPTFDSLAASGTIFERAYCPVPLCTPSRLCTLAGERAREAGAWSNGSMLPERCTSVAESFSAGGYDTCLVGKMHLGGDRQFVGFDHRPYGDVLGGNGHQYEPVSPEDRTFEGAGPIANGNAGLTEYPESQLQESQVIQETAAWLREQRHRSDAPWFLTASLSRPHHPYTAPPRHYERYWPDGTTPPVTDGDPADHPSLAGNRVDEDEQVTSRARAAYAACVDYLDELVGDLLAVLDREGFLDDTVVVYASDHGDMAGEYGLWDKDVWAEGSARVPLTIQTPEQRAGEAPARRVGTPVSLVDLHPTLCSLAGVDAPDVGGADVSAAVEGGSVDRGPVLVDNFREYAGPGTEYRAAVDGRYKYVHFRGVEDLLFDVVADPLERTNLVDDPDHAAPRERLREVAAVDFATVDGERERDRRATADRSLEAGVGTAGNAYVLRDGRVVDADSVVTKPDVLVGDPERAFADWPGAAGGDAE
jgi:choline-sulfatase